MISRSYRGKEVLVRQRKTCVLQEEGVQISPSPNLSDSLKYLRWSAIHFCTVNHVKIPKTGSAVTCSQELYLSVHLEMFAEINK